MKFKITYINPATGEEESVIIEKENCWDAINEVYSKTIPERKIKPVNFKLELIFGAE